MHRGVKGSPAATYYTTRDSKAFFCWEAGTVHGSVVTRVLWVAFSALFGNFNPKMCLQHNIYSLVSYRRPILSIRRGITQIWVSFLLETHLQRVLSFRSCCWRSVWNLLRVALPKGQMCLVFWMMIVEDSLSLLLWTLRILPDSGLRSKPNPHQSKTYICESQIQTKLDYDFNHPHQTKPFIR